MTKIGRRKKDSPGSQLLVETKGKKFQTDVL